MPLQHDYPERVYAGVLGKIIGVYLGRPFEGWSYEDILRRFGEITYYVNDRMGRPHSDPDGPAAAPPLVVTDDDISGTFTFVRALCDNDDAISVTPAQIGETWLNYIIEGRTILWWGGMGNSTEHTAYLRLKSGIPAPQSGSARTNGRIVAEQIGAQIFIDGWAMAAPANPDLAAELARRAASVSHDGEAVYAAQVLAAMESAAFRESGIDALLDIGVSYIPKESTIYRLISDLRAWHAGERDWHKAFARIQKTYGYDRYGGNVHVVPNHALVILGLLYGAGDFRTSMKVVNTAGWDTDCNSGNLGCLLGIRNGLRAFDGGPDWRGPVRDRILMPTADGGGTVTDAVQQALRIVHSGRRIAGEPVPELGAVPRFSFPFPGAVQGFRADGQGVTVENAAGHSRDGSRSLAVRFTRSGLVITPTFIQPDELDMTGYGLFASPTLYPGQTVRARVSAEHALTVRVLIRAYGMEGRLSEITGPERSLEAGDRVELEWTVPDTGGQPIAQIGFAPRDPVGEPNALFVDSLTWSGAPAATFARPSVRPSDADVWRRAWTNGMDEWSGSASVAYRMTQNHGCGLLIQGTREWQDYEAEASVATTLAAAAGIAVRVQGMRRYYALLLVHGGLVRIVKRLGGERVLSEAEFAWELETPYRLRLRVSGNRLTAQVNDEVILEAEDTEEPLTGGAAGFVLTEGFLVSDAFTVRP